ncbi:MAG: sterol desaturase family protein, partial [Catalinimonas sp.]
LWVHHSIHHFKDDERAFGVSSPLWDWVFGTMPRRAHRREEA